MAKTLALPRRERDVSDLALLQQQADAGQARAQYRLGARLLVGREAQYAPQDALRWLEAATAQDEPDALQLMAVLTALGEGRAQSWSAARGLVERAAARGDARARGQLAIIGEDIATWLAPAQARRHFEAPRIATIENFLPANACAWIMDKARPRLEAARVKNPAHGGANADSYRSNTGMGFSVLDTDLVLQLTHARIAAAIGLPVQQQEPTNILHYEPGQQYKPHFDFLDPSVAHFHGELTRLGQRVATCLIYLNDEYEGGETVFPRLNWRFNGKAGDALAFWNVTPDGVLDPLTLHAGAPTNAGEKFLLSKWVRDRPVPLI
jgi:prolyl 4-hydroxylase